MRPPICEVCNERFDPAEGDLVRFEDYRPLDREGWVGHPDGLGWFCPVHVAAARRLIHLGLRDAVRVIKEGGPGDAETE